MERETAQRVSKRSSSSLQNDGDRGRRHWACMDCFTCVCGVQGKVSTQHAPHSFQHSKRSDHSTPQCVCGTLHSNNTELMDSMLVTPLRLSLPLLFHVASMGNPLRGAAHWLLVQMVKSIPVCSGVGAVRPGGLLPSVPILSSLLI